MQRLSSEDESSKLVHAITDSSSVTRIDALATDYLARVFLPAAYFGEWVVEPASPGVEAVKRLLDQVSINGSGARCTRSQFSGAFCV